MNKIINSNDQLKAYFPNVMIEDEGEATLFDKVAPQLTLSEAWLRINILGDVVYNELFRGLHDALFVQASSFIVNDAMSKSLSSLDVILTPNGFGVVSNNTIAPASKDRVEALKKSLTLNAGRAIEAIYKELANIEVWQNSRQFEWFTNSFYQSISDAEYDWKRFLSLRQAAAPSEMEISDRWLGPELSATLKKVLATHPDAPYPLGHVARSVGNIVVRATQEYKLDRRALASLVDIIRNDSNSFPEWHASAVAQLFTPPLFENKKTSGGYFF